MTTLDLLAKTHQYISIRKEEGGYAPAGDQPANSSLHERGGIPIGEGGEELAGHPRSIRGKSQLERKARKVPSEPTLMVWRRRGGRVL